MSQGKENRTRPKVTVREILILLAVLAIFVLSSFLTDNHTRKQNTVLKKELSSMTHKYDVMSHKYHVSDSIWKAHVKNCAFISRERIKKQIGNEIFLKAPYEK